MQIPVVQSLLTFSLTGAIALGGVYFGSVALQRDGAPPRGNPFAHSDALHYRDIVTSGYSYDQTKQSLVAFFPVFPLTARLVGAVGALDPVTALLVTSNGYLAATFVVIGAYLRSRGEPSRGANSAESVLGRGRVASTGVGMRACETTAREERAVCSVDYTLLLFGLLPFTFFFRMPYSESSFLLFCTLSLYAMQRRWRLPLTAFLVGITTACRPVGVALVPPFLLHVWQQSPTRSRGTMRCLALLPLACWGILAFIVFLYVAFGEPFAFARTQQHWALQLAPSAVAKCVSLLSWEPIWATYDPAVRSLYWMNSQPACGVFNCQFINPIYFILTAALIFIGALRGSLCSEEVLLSVGLLAIPYITKAYESGMNSQGRYAAAVFPAYLVAGELLRRVPGSVAISILAVSGFFMGAYASLFAAGYPFF